MATIFERVRKITVNQLGVNEEEVTPSSSFVDDLGADSLDMVEIIIALEEEFTTTERKMSIPDEDTEKIITVQNALDYLRDKGASDNELSKSAVKAAPQPTPRPGSRPEPSKSSLPPRPAQNTRPTPPPNRAGQNRPGGNRHGEARPPQNQPRQGQPPHHPPQPPKAPGNQPPTQPAA